MAKVTGNVEVALTTPSTVGTRGLPDKEPSQLHLKCVGSTDRQVETVTTVTTGCHCYCNDYLCPDHNPDLQVIFHIHTPQLYNS